MIKLDVISKAFVMSLCISSFFLQSCGGRFRGDGGELVGVANRVGWQQTVPFGMVVCPSGTFHMGQADEDIAVTRTNLNKQVTIGGFFMDDTEITNNEYRQFVNAMLEDSIDVLGEEYIMSELYPDTSVWLDDFSHHMGDPMVEYYYDHPAFDDYPLVGVNWKAAKYFCAWRTSYLNSYRSEIGLWKMPRFRLPSEAEWEYASRGGRDMVKYPWGSPYIRNARGCLLANFKPGRGNYYDDGFMYTSPVGSFFSNDYGLFDMSGNVAEWCEDAFSDSYNAVVWDLNPTFFDEREPRKVVRGGSWKDIAYYLETGTRTFEFEDSTKSFIGFRCAVTYLGRSSGAEF